LFVIFDVYLKRNEMCLYSVQFTEDYFFRNQDTNIIRRKVLYLLIIFLYVRVYNVNSKFCMYIIYHKSINQGVLILISCPMRRWREPGSFCIQDWRCVLLNLSLVETCGRSLCNGKPCFV